MLRTLELQGYRGFESFRLPDLRRVNLLVGRNNCGKTSILEAVDFLASRGDPSVLARSLSLVRTGNGFLLIDEIDTGLPFPPPRRRYG